MTDEDWLCVVGDTAEDIANVAWALDLLSRRFARVLWVPGNHELWTPQGDPDGSRGEERYQRLVGICRESGVLTPEDPYPVWTGDGGPVAIAPLFLLYDYTFRPDGTDIAEESLRVAHDAGVVCTDEMLLHPDPYTGRAEWCRARFEDVSLDYPREWKRFRGASPYTPQRILPGPRREPT